MRYVVLCRRLALLVLVMGLVVPAPSRAAPAPKVPPLRAGAAAVDITPTQFPVNMPGGFSANMAQGAHDPLHARALILDDGTVELALVVVDTLAVAPEAAAEAKALASQRCGIAPEHILISATHTHTAPPSNSTSGPPAAVAYRKILIDGIAESVVRAHAALRPAAVGAATGPLPEEVFNRRWFLKPGKMPPNPFGQMDKVKMNPGTSADVLDHPAGPTDPDITVLSVQDAKRKPLAMYANYSLHYVGGMPKAMVSADYYGEFARLIPSRVGGGPDFVAMMSNGASGNINNIPFLVDRPPREPFEQIRIVAQKAADATWHAWKGIPAHRSDVRLGMLQRDVILRLRRPTAEQIAAAKAVLAVRDEAGKAKLPRLAEHYARSTLAIAERKEETVKVQLQALRIGDLGMCGIPFEAFCEIGLELEKRSPFPRTMVIGLANGRHGYLPTPAQHKLGGYETWLSTNVVQEDASVLLVDQLLEMLGTLAKEDGQRSGSAAVHSDFAGRIAAPTAGPGPRFNGAAVFGVRPGSPILYTLAVTGQPPVAFTAEGLPDGARLDSKKGQITGTVSRRGTYRVRLCAANAAGRAERAFTLVVGDTFALTPPMGCNTWGGLGPLVSEKGVRASAEALVRSGLINHGYCYVNIDDGWQGQRGGPYHAIQPNEKFGSMKALCDDLHAMGLKVGNYSTPWRTSYAGFVGGSSDDAEGTWAKLPPGPRQGWAHGTYRFEINDARQAAEWGIDYFKYDWGIDNVELARTMGDALHAQRRDIVFELSNSAPLKNGAAYTAIGTMTRTAGDLVDVWDKTQLDTGKQKWALGVRDLWLAHKQWEQFNRPGHWNMPCPLRVGMLGGWDNKPLRPTRLTVDEQFAHISLWCLWGAPLIVGAPIDKLDSFTMSLLTNDEVLDIDQDPLGLQARDIDVAGGEVLVKRLADGAVAAGLFNPGATTSTVAVTWSQAGVTGPQRVRDLWKHNDLGIVENGFTATVPSHGVVLVKLAAAPAGTAGPSCRGALASKVEVTYTFKDRHEEKKSVMMEPDAKGASKFSIRRSELPPDVESIAIVPEFAIARTGEEGYFVMPNGHLGSFRQREGIARLWASCMPMFGMKTPRMIFAAIVTGMPYNYSLVAQAQNGVYRFGPVFDRGLDRSDEDIAIEFHTLTGDDANYAGMARVYRKYQLDRKACVPLRERIKHSPELAYAARCPEVRIRQGWKPVPSPVPDQTVKNEPPMKVMVTFDRVGNILDEFRRQGIDAAEICLVGWNQKGHDGRWPQIFPVEESLGGEERLRAVVKKAQQMGYQIVGHANQMDAYLIADCWDTEYIRKNRDGALPHGKTTWGGGRVYTICAQRAYERFAVNDTPRIAALGFRGLHYLDVFTCLPPAPCGDPQHPVNERRTAFFIDRIMQLGKAAFGGVASEGPYDFCCGNLDSVLYVSFDKPAQPMPKLVDRFVPIWQLVYNGIILSNPFTTTVNYTAQDRISQLKLIEFNGRPAFYFYSRFKDDGKNWMGEGDLGCAHEMELRDSVAKIKRGCDEFRRLAPLQLAFMEQHEQLAPEVFRTAFSDGSEIITNYGSAEYYYKSRTVEALNYLLIRRPESE